MKKIFLVVAAISVMAASGAWAGDEQATKAPKKGEGVTCTLTQYGPRVFYLIGPKSFVDVPLHFDSLELAIKEFLNMLTDEKGGFIEKHGGEVAAKKAYDEFQHTLVSKYRYPGDEGNFSNDFMLSCPVNDDKAEGYVYVKIETGGVVTKYKEDSK